MQQTLGATPEQRLFQMLEKLKSRNFRITPQRLAVLRILAASENHPSAEQIYEQVRSEFPTTSIATIYKTVSLLKELHELLELGFPDGSNRYDGNKPFPHPHLICVECKQIIDPLLTSAESVKDEITQKTGFKILHHRMDFFGICARCAKAREMEVRES